MFPCGHVTSNPLDAGQDRGSLDSGQAPHIVPLILSLGRQADLREFEGLPALRSGTETTKERMASKRLERWLSS